MRQKSGVHKATSEKAVWKRIARAVEEMQRTDRPSGEALQ